ncbi:MAG: hydroxysqualene dehydroxylase HpnE, partial [Dehalococcoidia bacterium]
GTHWEYMSEDPIGKPVRPSVIVIGGGLAGLSAAFQLCDRGYKVTLLEKRGFVGGRAFSFTDKVTGFEVDNGQHVFMKCCTYYVGFLKKLGVYDRTYVQDRMKVQIIDGAKGASGLSSASLPTPFHLMPSFLRFKHLSTRDKALAIFAFLRIIAIGHEGRKALDGQTFYDWLLEHHQTKRAIDNFWSIIILPTLNDDVHHVSTNQAMMVFQEGFFKDPRGADIGYSRVGLTSLLGEEAPEYIRARGGEVMLSTNAASLIAEDGRISGVALGDGHNLTADYYVSAVPYHALSSILPSQIKDEPFFNKAANLTSSPIVNVHLWYDRPLARFEFAGFLNSRVQWVFNKSRMLREGGSSGQYLCLSLSGAREYVDMSKGEIGETFLREMEKALPGARQAKALQTLVVKEPMATFSPAPGALRCRLSPSTPIDNLFLAGEWTDTDWPSTMEGAVRSGVAAAREMVRRHEGFRRRS